MTRLRLLNRLRTQPFYRPMLATLAELGIEEYEITPPRGCGHPILKFKINGRSHRVALPGSGGRASSKYLPAEIRKLARG